MAPSAEEEVTRFLHPWSYPTGVQMYLWNECTLTFTSRSLEVFFFHLQLQIVKTRALPILSLFSGPGSRPMPCHWFSGCEWGDGRGASLASPANPGIQASSRASGAPRPERLPRIVRATLLWACRAVQFSVLPGVESIRQMERIN